jgi:predicted signal transduction protein with EAL and GGDEF domain
VVEIAERVATALAEPTTYSDDTIVGGGSVGIAISDSLSDADSLLREADRAMYQAKATARGGVEFFDEALRADLHHDAAFRLAMAEALTNGELKLYSPPSKRSPAGNARASAWSARTSSSPRRRSPG